jgi:hypothetical protein
MMPGVPLVPWHLLVALWEARALMAWLWLCRRYPLAAWFVLGFIRGLFGRR